jgi:hypothetical protein
MLRATTATRQARLREGLLLLGFVLVLAAAVITVLVPELGKDPSSDTQAAPTERAR